MKKQFIVFILVLSVSGTISAQLGVLGTLGVLKGVEAIQESKDKKKRVKELIVNLEMQLNVAEASLQQKALTSNDIFMVQSIFSQLVTLDSKKSETYTKRVEALSVGYNQQAELREQEIIEAQQRREAQAEKEKIAANKKEFSRLLNDVYDGHMGLQATMEHIKRLRDLTSDTKNDLLFPDTLYAIRGEAYYEGKMYKDAEIDLKKYLAIKPDNLYYKKVLGQAYMAQQKDAEVEKVHAELSATTENKNDVDLQKLNRYVASRKVNTNSTIWKDLSDAANYLQQDFKTGTLTENLTKAEQCLYNASKLYEMQEQKLPKEAKSQYQRMYENLTKVTNNAAAIIQSPERRSGAVLMAEMIKIQISQSQN
jgi:tetratricopeptide (TPR) repeat protein